MVEICFRNKSYHRPINKKKAIHIWTHLSVKILLLFIICSYFSVSTPAISDNKYEYANLTTPKSKPSNSVEVTPLNNTTFDELINNGYTEIVFSNFIELIINNSAYYNLTLRFVCCSDVIVLNSTFHAFYLDNSYLTINYSKIPIVRVNTCTDDVKYSVFGKPYMNYLNIFNSTIAILYQYYVSSLYLNLENSIIHNIDLRSKNLANLVNCTSTHLFIYAGSSMIINNSKIFIIEGFKGSEFEVLNSDIQELRGYDNSYFKISHSRINLLLKSPYSTFILESNEIEQTRYHQYFYEALAVLIIVVVVSISLFALYKAKEEKKKEKTEKTTV